MSYAPDISMKNAAIDPATLTFDLSDPKPYHSSIHGGPKKEDIALQMVTLSIVERFQNFSLLES